MATVVGYNKPLRCDCENCHAIVEYVPNEIKQVSSTDYRDNYTEVYKFIDCPGCGKRIYL